MISDFVFFSIFNLPISELPIDISDCFDLKNMKNMALKRIGQSCGNIFSTSFQLQVASKNNNS